ncbi:transcriptional regulator, XRE family [Segniliparus rotundus DSM 44985]|uniref:Transcriptional regulator, XRE family n=1 Tax=Segniliparus rotundus (strain ATCC BAA-972 / CDC 1076 / CIP 108378 / DSM 44985 / JCM 13578) TaxID=640132 RepID=D6Z9J0_SEGRD|nr:helix-turn-helix transcriptional regulator [Segniliparus rotundus]ADG96517.1 transcriptional regulator, XRE family [Segniliparus rotundus DSM 44985]
MLAIYDSGTSPEISLKYRLLIARMEAGLEQSQLAERTGISVRTIRNAERGHTSPKQHVIYQWALATGVPATWLLTGQDPNKNGGPDGPSAGTYGSSD